MFASPDGVCGLAFSSRAAEATGEGAVFVSGLGGDYPLAGSPLHPYAADSSTQAQLEAQANKRTNVRLESPGGKVIAKPHATMPIVGFNLLDTTADCEHLLPALTGTNSFSLVGYTLIKTTVSCPVVRTVIWAWSADEGTATHTGKPKANVLIAGWHCVGTNLLANSATPTYSQVTCSKGTNVIEVQAVRTRTSSEGPPP
jgi:hypothetical protein